MINNSDAVPARIVIMGTSKLRLSERFNRIESEKSHQKQQQQLVRKDEVLSVNGGPIIERPRVFNNQSITERGLFSGKSFLHDSYMDNDLYGEPTTALRTLSSNISCNYAHNNYEEVNPVNMTLEDYNIYQRINPRRSSVLRYGNRINYRNHNFTYDQGEYFSETFSSRFRSKQHAQPFRPSIQQRLSYKPRISEFSLRRPIRNNTVVFKKQFVGRFNSFGARRYWQGGKNNRGQFRKNRWNEKRIKTVQELDRELEDYMKSGKHPRIQPATN